MQITVHRGPEVWRERRSMPAATYNLARTLQMRSPQGVAFVPIRSLQVLAIVDRHEFVFVDSVERARLFDGLLVDLLVTLQQVRGQPARQVAVAVPGLLDALRQLLHARQRPAGTVLAVGDEPEHARVQHDAPELGEAVAVAAQARVGHGLVHRSVTP